MAKDFGKVAVLMGGPSAEREVSLMSGTGIVKALKERGVDAHPFDPAERDLFELKRDGFARVFIALHGRFGEDGTVQGALEVMKLPYTGSGVMASAIAMDKWRTKMIWQSAGIPTPKYRILNGSSDWHQTAQDLGLPLIVKPGREGSTIGLTKLTSTVQLGAAYELAAKFDPLVIAEEFVDGKELTVSVLGERALRIVRIEAPQGNYDYQNKYFTDDTKYHCPSGIDSAIETRIQADTMKAFRLLGCRGWGRADVMLRADGSYSFLELNTSPGMTGHSLVPISARADGIDYPDLCVEILALATTDAEARA
ncbi:MAG: D-alanine--D-alanine ligase [Burkholderiales bacterium]|nr:D-alanine--D-alanine ligase [Burkholderiales bacterium]